MRSTPGSLSSWTRVGRLQNVLVRTRCADHFVMDPVSRAVTTHVHDRPVDAQLLTSPTDRREVEAVGTFEWRGMSGCQVEIGEWEHGPQLLVQHEHRRVEIEISPTPAMGGT